MADLHVTTAAERVDLLDTYMGGTYLELPPAPSTAERAGTSSGEWDAYYLADDRTRRFIRRHLCDAHRGFAPDQVAANMGLDVETFWDGLVRAVMALQDGRRHELYDDSEPTLADLLGPSEVAEWLGVTTNAVAQWRARTRRGQLPVPFPAPATTLSGRDIFDARAVEAWAIETERLSTVPDLPAF